MNRNDDLTTVAIATVVCGIGFWAGCAATAWLLGATTADAWQAAAARYSGPPVRRSRAHLTVIK